MSDFIVSARKYRPATFASVVGQKHITSTLKNAIERGQLAHAYLFCGPRGVGKTTCARIFAKAINCLNPNGSEACNECESCRSFNEGRSLNIHELDAASNNSVEDIRTLIEQVRIIPQVGRYSVFIIDEVHMLSAAAFNAFLKTLEEPPAHAIFILATTEKHKIIPTILSRCQIYDFNRIRVEDGVEYLKYIASQEGIAADEERHTAERLFRAMAFSERLQENNCATAILHLGGHYTPPGKIIIFGGTTDGNLERSVAYERQAHAGRSGADIRRAMERGNRYAARILTWASAGDMRNIALLERCRQEGRNAPDTGRFAVCPNCGNLYPSEYADWYCPACLTEGKRFVLFE